MPECMRFADDELEAYLLGCCPPGALASTVAHLPVCSDCRDGVAESREFLDAMRAALISEELERCVTGIPGAPEADLERRRADRTESDLPVAVSFEPQKGAPRMIAGKLLDTGKGGGGLFVTEGLPI